LRFLGQDVTFVCMKKLHFTFFGDLETLTRSTICLHLWHNRVSSLFHDDRVDIVSEGYENIQVLIEPMLLM